MAPSGEIHPRQSLLGAPRSWHSDKVTHVPTVTAHSPCLLCPWEHSSLSPDCPQDRTDPAKGSSHCHGADREPQRCKSSENNRQIKGTVGQGCAASPMCSVGPARPHTPHRGDPRQAMSTAEEGWVNHCCSGGVPWAHGSSIQSHLSWARGSRGLLSHILYFNTGSCCSPLGAA